MGSYLEELPNARKRRLEESDGQTASKGGRGRHFQSKEAIDPCRPLKEFEQYSNPDPLFRLIGEANETESIINGVKLGTLIDSGAQMSSITESMARHLGLEFIDFRTLMEIEGTGGIDVPYIGYTAVNLKLPEIPSFDEDCLFFIYPDSKYGKRVPISLGTIHIDRVLEVATDEELKNIGKSWRRGAVGRKLIAKMAGIELKDTFLDKIEADVKLTKKITIPPRQAMKVVGMAHLPHLTKRLNVTTDEITDF